MGVARVDRKLLAILAADMVGFSGAMEADEPGTIARLRTLHANFRRAAERAISLQPSASTKRPGGYRCVGTSPRTAQNEVAKARGPSTMPQR